MNTFRFRTAMAIAMLLVIVANADASSLLRLSPSDEKLVRDLELKSWDAWKNQDAKFFEKFLSEDHVDIHAGGISGKGVVVDGIRSSMCVVQNFSLGVMALTRVSADAVLVTYRAEQDTKCGTAKVPSPVWATSLYVKRTGRWVNVLYQQTPLG